MSNLKEIEAFGKPLLEGEHIINHLTIGSVEMFLVQNSSLTGRLILKDTDYPITAWHLFLSNIKVYRNRTTISDVDCPSHYSLDFPLIDFVYINKLSFLQGNFIKYLIRLGRKDNFIEDIDKCKSYLQMIINAKDFKPLVFPAEIFASINKISGFKKESLILFDKAFSDEALFNTKLFNKHLKEVIHLLDEQKI